MSAEVARRAAARRAGVVAALAALLFGALVPATRVGAELRRIEAVGAVPATAAAQGGLRQAALRAALADAALRAASSLVEAETGTPPGEDLAGVLGEKPEEYAVSFRLVEDRGEQPAMLTSEDPSAREYVVVAEVQVDLGRVRARLREAGRLAGAAAPPAAAQRVRLELLDLPGPAAYTAIRDALLAAGANPVIPLELAPGRALLELAGLPAAVAVERLRAAPLPEGLRVEPLPSEGEGAPRRVRVVRGPPPDAETAAPGLPLAPGEAPAAEAEGAAGGSVPRSGDAVEDAREAPGDGVPAN